MSAEKLRSVRAGRFRLGDRWVTAGADEIDGARVDAKAMDVLVALVEAAPSVVPAAALLDRVWPNVVVVDNVVHQAVAQLRRVLGDDARAPRYIETIPRRGYRLIADVAYEAPIGNGSAVNGVDQAHSLDPAVANGGSTATHAPQSNRWSGKMSRPAVAIVVFAVIASVVAIGLVNRAMIGENRDGRVEIGEFELLTKDTAAGGFVRGLVSAVARAFAADTITTVAREAGGAEPGTEFVLRGTVDFEEGRYVVSTEILHRGDGQILWSAVRRQDTDDAGPFEEQVGIFAADVVACALGLRRLSNADVSAVVFSRVLHYCEARVDFKLDESRELARRIYDAAPQLALAHALLAKATAASIDGKPEAEAERLRQSAYEHARIAIQMDPTNPGMQSYVDRLYAFINDPARTLAERERLLQRSLAIAPSQEALYPYAYLLSGVGRIRDAFTYYVREAKTFPNNGSEEVAYLDAALGEVDVAREMFKAEARISPTDSYLILKWFWAEFWYGDPEIARHLFRSPGSVWGNKPRLDETAAPCIQAVLDARFNHTVLDEDQIAAACPAGTDHLDGIYAYFGHVDAAYRVAAANRGFSDPFAPYMRAVRADSRFMPFIARPDRVDYWLETDRWPDFCGEEQLPYNCKEAALAVRAIASQHVAPASYTLGF